MDLDFITSMAKEALLVSIISSLPAIAASLIIGLIIAIFSATTQIQEQTLSFAPKMMAVYVSILIFGSYIASLILEFAKRCFSFYQGY